MQPTMTNRRVRRIAAHGASVLTLALLPLVTGTACRKQAPIVQSPPPPLEVPVVPPRWVGPVMVEEPEITPIATAEPAPPRPRPTRPAPVRQNDPVVRVDPPPDPTAKPTDTPGSGQPGAGASGQPDAAPLLRTPATANDEEVLRKVRDILSRAGSNLNKINYNGLNAGAKAQHDSARRFIQQSEDALKVKNLVFATFLAEKAENISGTLLNR